MKPFGTAGETCLLSLQASDVLSLSQRRNYTKPKNTLTIVKIFPLTQAVKFQTAVRCPNPLILLL